MKHLFYFFIFFTAYFNSLLPLYKKGISLYTIITQNNPIARAYSNIIKNIKIHLGIGTDTAIPSFSFDDIKGHETIIKNLKGILDIASSFFSIKTPQLQKPFPRSFLLYLFIGKKGTGKKSLILASSNYLQTNIATLDCAQSLSIKKIKNFFSSVYTLKNSIIMIENIDLIHDKNEYTTILEELDTCYEKTITKKNNIIVMITAQEYHSSSHISCFFTSEKASIFDIKPISKNHRISLIKKRIDENPMPVNVSAQWLVSTINKSYNMHYMSKILHHATIIAKKNNHIAIEKSDIAHAMDTAEWGYYNNNPSIELNYNTIISFHEIGHAITLLAQKDSLNTVEYISLRPNHHNHAGTVIYEKEDEDHEKPLSIKNIFAFINTLLAGPLTEELFFNTASFFHHKNDLERAREYANMIAKTILLNKGLSITAENIAKESNHIIQQCTEKTKSILKKNACIIPLLAKQLEEKKVLLAEDIFSTIDQYNKTVSTDNKIILGLL